MYRVVCVSTLVYLMQLCVLPRRFAVAEHAALRRLLLGPGSWIAMGTIFQLPEVLGSTVRFPSLAVLSHATVIKTAIKFEAEFCTMRDDIQSAWNDEERPLRPPRLDWCVAARVPTSLSLLTAAREGGIVTDCLGASVLTKRRLATFWIYKALMQQAAHRPLAVALRVRARRWTQRHLLSLPEARVPDALLLRWKRLRKHLPPCVLLCTFNEFMNGWCTAFRMRRALIRCTLHASCTGDDTLVHYLQCPMFAAFAWERFGLARDAAVPIMGSF